MQLMKNSKKLTGGKLKKENSQSSNNGESSLHISDISESEEQEQECEQEQEEFKFQNIA